MAPITTGPADVPAPASGLLLEEPCEPHHQQGLLHARAHRWHWAQHELELAVRATADGAAHADLESVRAVRRQLRLLQKWPRDAQVYVALGRAYMELELGAEAEQAFRRAMSLAPGEPTAYYLLALEYAYRGATEEAECVYRQAQELDPGLPPFATLLATWQARWNSESAASLEAGSSSARE